MEGGELAHGWEAATCAGPGGVGEYTYYWNRFTSETTWERPLPEFHMRKRSRIGTKQWSGPSGCFLWPMRPQVPVRRSKMSQSVDVFSVLLKRGMPGATRQDGQHAAKSKAGKPAAKGKAAKGAKKAKGKSDDKEPEPASAPATEDWWRGTQEAHAYLPLETLVACARVSKGWRAALVDNGFNYGVAVLGISLARWRVQEGGELNDDVDALSEMSKRLSVGLKHETMASGERLREVRQFLCRHGELSQKNATCRGDAAAKPFLPKLFQGDSFLYIFDAGFWLSLAALEPEGSYLSEGVKRMMWAFVTPADLPSEYLVVQEASDAVHVEDEDEEEEVWGQQDETLTCRECKQTFVFSKGEQIFYRQQGLDSKPGRCKPCLRGLKAKPPVVLSAKAEVKKKGIQVTGLPGGGGVGGSDSYKISNREATRDMDWLCAISSMEGTQHKTMRRTDPKPQQD